MLRTTLLAFCAAFGPLLAAVAAQDKAEVNLDYVIKHAEGRAREPFRSPRADMPEVLRQDKLNYDNYRKIRFRHDQALWLADKLPFRVEFFHPGYIYQEPVRTFEFTKAHVQRIRFVQDFFDYSDLKIENQIPANTGYAGFKIAHPLNKPGEYSELGSFLGASYFRLLGKGQRYGQSARGLALDCGEPDRPEEFPIFTDFWLGKPAPEDAELRLYAVLDSVTCTGAYEFRIRPGEATIVDIEAVLFFREEDKIRAVNKDRKPLATIGMAPMTSMFWFGENSERKFDDYRPEVHDSDGLLMHMGNGEVVWRPLNNAPVMRHSVFATNNIRGFGLLQRDRDFSSYEEIFNLYHQTPSVWIKPKGDWGEGEVHLVELSTNYEGLDNIVSFWNPKQKPAPMQPFRFAYQMLWARDTEFQLSENRVIATRVGAELHDPKKRQVHLDFTGPKLDANPANEPPQAVVNCGENARIYETQVLKNTFNNTWRVMLKFEPKADNKEPVDLRCTLKKGEDNVSETWVYLWSPP
ncbi:MAG: glucan biosynthesis protein G [Verrucomicrobiota bacterium]|nr:glucan biosynthesis protein G [Verrucomicrobiota bacterium]